MSVTVDGGFTEHLHTQLITASNYNSLTGLHTVEITVIGAHVKSSVSSLVISW
jgi:hypothetical protein